MDSFADEHRNQPSKVLLFPGWLHSLLLIHSFKCSAWLAILMLQM